MGKPAGVRCVQLTDDNRCAVFGLPERPAICVALRPEEAMCGTVFSEAMERFVLLERLTDPALSSQLRADYRTIVSSRRGPVEITEIGQPVSSSMKRM
jgi:hypothetical protein